jgi:hypothetical protein
MSQYRVTLFYGPESVEMRSDIAQCVFNVKKRSWKGGVQVAVEMENEQIARARQAIGFDPWLQAALAAVPEAVRSDYERRAQDLFAQALCSLKLDLAVEAGLPQEHRTIPAGAFVDEVNRAVPPQADRIKAQILAELDIPNNAE